MGKKRKVSNIDGHQSMPTKTKYNLEEQFDDAEDEFFAGRDKILLDEEPTSKRQRLVQEQERDIQPSDEEVLDRTESEDDDFDDAQLTEAEDIEDVEEEDENNWGTTKADYYNADLIETEADALDEEKEAKRLQQKQLKSMTDADFGFDDYSCTQSEVRKVSSGPVVEKLPEARIPAGAKEEEMISMLYQRYPEFKLLARDLIELQVLWNRLQKQDATAGVLNKGITAQLKLKALTSYLGAIAMYFAVVTSKVDPNAEITKITSFPPNELREHAVIENLVSSRQLWDAVKNVKEMKVEKQTVPNPNDFEHEKVVKFRVDGEKPKPKKERVIPLELNGFQMPELPKKTKREKKLLDLESLLAQSAVPEHEEGSDFGDEEPLTEQQAAEKARKKKSLRFYTSQIAQKANKRGAASRGAGGDDDVPRKERLRDKQERLLQEAEKRGQEKATAEEELGGESEDDVLSQQGDEYYQSLVAESKLKQAEKKAKADAFAEAARQGAQVYEEEQVGADGKRRITYAIEKNKGLAPKRKKDVRNPRVKKRKKYDEKMKKLGSIRQVYKPEGRGGYGGELTGIKTNIVKSIKL